MWYNVFGVNFQPKLWWEVITTPIYSSALPQRPAPSSPLPFPIFLPIYAQSTAKNMNIDANVQRARIAFVGAKAKLFPISFICLYCPFCTSFFFGQIDIFIMDTLVVSLWFPILFVTLWALTKIFIGNNSCGNTSLPCYIAKSPQFAELTLLLLCCFQPCSHTGNLNCATIQLTQLHCTQ